MNSQDYVNFRNGVLNVRTLEFLKHDPAFGCTNVLNANYNRQADLSKKFKIFSLLLFVVMSIN